MDPLYISIISFLISLLAVFISFVALLRDRHKVKVVVVPTIGEREISAQVTVQNHGKRPIAITHAAVNKVGQPRHMRMFIRKPESDVRVEEGQSEHTQIKSGDILHIWTTFEELCQCEFAVLDALGKWHKAKRVKKA